MRRIRKPKGECTIPPAIPDAALSDLMCKRDLDAEKAIRGYVEREGKEEVTHAEHVATEYVFGRKLEAWDVRTTKGRWWVITTPQGRRSGITSSTNLYSQELFQSLDYTISFHVGVTIRMASRDQAKPRVQTQEQALMPAAWRKWQQAAEALDEAEEPEDFQAVGMRCREALKAMVKAIATSQMVPAGTEAPKRGDVPNWCALVANHVARGGSAKNVRTYLKSISHRGWDLAGWLTHAEHATSADALLTVEATHHTLGTFGSAVFRYAHGIPDRCPTCGSYQIGLRHHPEDVHGDPLPGCERCGWFACAGSRWPPR